MMDVVKKLIAEKGGDMIGPLVAKLGFSEEQAKNFLPAAIQGIMGKVMGADKDPGSSFNIAGLLGDGGPDLNSVIGDVDADGIAAEAGVTPEQAKSGLQEIAPSMLDGLKQQGPAALLGALGGGDGGGVMGSIGKMAGGLFGK